MRVAQSPIKYTVLAVVCAFGIVLLSACGKKAEDTAGAASNETTKGQATLNQGTPGQVSRPNLDTSK